MAYFSLNIDDGLTSVEIKSLDKDTLRLVGKHHHKAANPKPELTLSDSVGTVIATMDVWAIDWVEAGQ